MMRILADAHGLQGSNFAETREHILA